MTTALAVSGGGQELYELLQLLEIVAWACKAMQNHHDGAGGGQLMVALQQTGGKGAGVSVYIYIQILYVCHHANPRKLEDF